MKKDNPKALTENKIANIIAAYYDYGKSIILPNYASGLTGWEADVIILRETGWAEEVEIKTSLSDFKAEFKNKIEKHKKLMSTKHYCKKFWFAMPQELAAKAIDLIPEYAGLYAIGSYNRVKVIKNAPTLKNAEKIPDDKRAHIMKCAYHRLWTHLIKRK